MIMIDLITNTTDLLLQGRISDARDLLGKNQGQPIPAPSRRTSGPTQQYRVFVRDRFICRYCGQQTFFVPILRAISIMMPDEFPYHPNWKMSECHIAYWRFGASIDHVVPVARGGDGSSENNLVTSCYMCNSIKQYWLLEELRWELKTPSQIAWDGLASRLPALCEMGQLGQMAYFGRWLRAIHNIGL
jgi:hypothetical protein